MQVTLITHTPEPEQVIASAAKLCYSSSDIAEIMQDLSADKVESFIHKLMDLGHQSPLEHCTFTFGIEGVSRAMTHQLVRHRIASYSQKSQRYVNESQFEYITPTSIVEHDVAMSYAMGMGYLKSLYGYLIARGVPPEDARYVLPNACETKIVVTMNIRSLLHFFEERCCNRAQWEIREVADQMLRLCREVAPNIFADAGASCLRGRCKEGKMSCGQPKERMNRDEQQEQPTL